ncbi:ribonuclease 3 [Canna indica]|uniref:Ribonuclease 3 n=1 Tax=Canna indica TaxID=4628 RepID=A0AAQ3L4Z4_9LILI|nr:ribonuclease 3 [Canna indica]
MAARVLPLAFLCLMQLIASPFLVANADDGTSFDFYYLVLLWPGAYCTQSKCCPPTAGPPANDFSIRGLWPYSTLSGEPVTDCNSNPWSINQISSLRDELNLHWSNLKCPSNDGVGNWKSAWKTYGVCSGLNETQYFSTALQLRAKVDILALLAKKAIEPSLLYVHGVSDIENAIREGIGAAPLIRCSKGPLGLFQLYEVYICVDKDGETIIECPVKQSFTCSEEIFFTPFNLTSINPIDMVVAN